MSEFTQTDLTEYFEYLDDLRESGETNMFGARPYLQGEFEDLTIKDARRVLNSGWTLSRAAAFPSAFNPHFP